MIRERIIELLDAQRAKGLERYGHSIDDCPDNKYDWRLMAMEELIDLVQYQAKELIRLEKEIAAHKQTIMRIVQVSEV